MVDSKNNSTDSDNLKPPYVPKEWPGGFAAYKYSKAAVKTNLSSIIVLILLSLLVGNGLPYVLDISDHGVIPLLVEAFVMGGFAFAYIAGIKGKRVEIGGTFSAGAKYFLRMLGLYLLVALSLMAGLIALIVPFFIILPRLLLANYFLVDRNLGVLDAYKASWNETRGHSMKVYGILGVALLMILLMVTIIGIPFAIYMLVMYSAATAVLYEHIKTK